MLVIKSILIIALNLIIYTLLGSLVFWRRKGSRLNLGASMITGFFLYYILVFVICFPSMIKYRPLTWFITAFAAILAVTLLISFILNCKKLKNAVLELVQGIKMHPYAFLLLALVILLQVLLVTTTYNFTLDASYYVSNVTTSLETNMINVYDPFTGAWQDHYEVRYLFATYSINDAVVCFLTGIPALVQTKLVMSATVIIMVNILYFMIAKYLFVGVGDFKNNEAGDLDNIGHDKNIIKAVVMVYVMFFVNCTFNTIFTSSLFLLTRTYEGKTVVGNLSLLSIFYLFMLMMENENLIRPWLVIFIISLGSMTISSSANMLIPAELSLLFIPYMFIKRTIKPILKYFMCMIPGIAMVLIYVLYVKGYFVFYTYPR